jgi:hypothetical protein
VWPFERWPSGRADVLRVGRHSVELWRRRGVELALAEHAALEQPEAEALQRAVAQLLLPARKAALDVVVESAWLPVLAIEPGADLLSRTAVEALARHRFAALYGAAGAGSTAWDLIVDHRPGDRWGLAFGLLPSVRQAVLDAAAQAGRAVRSLQPALSWAHGHFGRRLPKRAWWVWVEQDRALVSFIDRGRIVALNSGAPAVRDASSVERVVQVERLRQGMEGELEGLVAAGWGCAPAGSGGMWLSVSTASSPVSSSSATTLGTQGAT